MPDRILVCLSALQTTAARCHRGRLVDCIVCRHDEAGLANFDEFVAPHPGRPVCFMADVVEEDYRFETLPHTHGADRRDMVQRRLRQSYRSTPYCAALPLGRDRDKRRDDRYLFSALTHATLLAPWLQVATARAMPVAGIYLLPIVSAALIHTLRIRATNVLLVSLQSGGLRLTFYRAGQFKLSRLTRWDGDRAADAARFITDEISSTRVYLHALRTTSIDEPLTLLLLDRSDELAGAAHTIARDNPSIECLRLGRRQLSSGLNVDESMLDLSADTIFLKLLAMRSPACNLAPPSVTAGFRRAQTRSAIYAAAGGIVLAGAVWSGINVWRALDTEFQRTEAARETTRLKAQYEEVRRSFPAAPTTAHNLKRTVEIARQLGDGARSPEPFMRIVSAAVDAAPGIVISGLAWRHGVGEGEADAGSPRAVTATARPAGTATMRRQSGVVTGEITPFHGDYRGAVATINAFADRMGRDPAVAETRILKLPLNVDPAVPLSGNTLESGDRPGVADFKILLLLKPGI